MIHARFSTVLAQLTRVRGVRAAMIVDAHDGVTIDAALQVGTEGSTVAALIASLYRKARRSAAAAGFGDTGFLQLEAERGRVCALGGEDVVLLVVTDRDVNVGGIRVDLLRAAELLIP